MIIRHLSQQHFAALEPDSRSAVIFIDNPPGYVPDLSDYGAGICLAFWDYEPKSLFEKILLRSSLSDRALAGIGQSIFRSTWRPLFQSDAKKIVDFGLALPEQIDTLICVCEFGRSRSRAVAEFFAHYYQVESFGDKSLKANRWVSESLTMAAWKSGDN